MDKRIIEGLCNLDTYEKHPRMLVGGDAEVDYILKKYYSGKHVRITIEELDVQIIKCVQCGEPMKTKSLMAMCSTIPVFTQTYCNNLQCRRYGS